MAAQIKFLNKNPVSARSWLEGIHGVASRKRLDICKVTKTQQAILLAVVLGVFHLKNLGVFENRGYPK